MFWKSIIDRSAPQVGISFLSQILSAFSRNAVIHSGSFFIQEISLTTSGLRPRFALKTNFSGSKKPYFSL